MQALINVLSVVFFAGLVWGTFRGGSYVGSKTGAKLDGPTEPQAMEEPEAVAEPVTNEPETISQGDTAEYVA